MEQKRIKKPLSNPSLDKEQEKKGGLNLENPDIDTVLDASEVDMNDPINIYALAMLTGQKVTREMAEAAGVKCGTDVQLLPGMSRERGGGMCCICGDMRCSIGPFVMMA